MPRASHEKLATVKLAWLTDIHLDFLSEASLARFCGDVSDSGADGILVGGDIATADSFERGLRALGSGTGKPIWFVLGNHDFYGGSVAGVRERAAALSVASGLVWLGGMKDCVELSSTTALVGHDGWGDGRLGDHAGSSVLLNDFFCIQDLLLDDKDELGRRLGLLGDEAAAQLRNVLTPALDRYPRVIVLTHVPPFREACWHQGEISDDEWLPYFTCKAVGDMLLEEVGRQPERLVTVLCGHTHSSGRFQALPNMAVLTGAATYGSPVVQQPLIEA